MKSAILKYLPNALTFCNMAIGVIVVCSMLLNDSLFSIRLACYLIYLAVVLDMLDGHLARYLNLSSEMGKQLNSFADLVTFGVAPIAIFVSMVQYISWYILLVLLFYPLAGAFRLARYNLQKDFGYFVGLPITVAGFIMVTILLVNSYIYSGFTMRFIIFYSVLTLALSIMMVSNFRVNRLIRAKELSAEKLNFKT